MIIGDCFLEEKELKTRLKTIRINRLTLYKAVCKMADWKTEDNIEADCDNMREL